MRYYALYYTSTNELAWTAASENGNTVEILDNFEAETGRSYSEIRMAEISETEFDKLNSD